jgi:hypothetical protein
MAFDNQNKELLSPDQTCEWLEGVVKTPIVFNLAGSIAISPLGRSFSAKVQKLGIESEHRSFGLDSSCVRHIWHDHGGKVDKRRDQVPVSLNDLLTFPTILKSAAVEFAPERPRSRGKVRLICVSNYESHEFTIIAEIRKKLIVPVTLWKKSRQAGSGA